jgi:hypothetical protein
VSEEKVLREMFGYKREDVSGIFIALLSGALHESCVISVFRCDVNEIFGCSVCYAALESRWVLTFRKILLAPKYYPTPPNSPENRKFH